MQAIFIHFFLRDENTILETTHTEKLNMQKTAYGILYKT